MANDTTTRLLARIKQLRLARGLTQEAFAERAGLTYKHYQQVETGLKPNFRIDTLVKMAEGLGLELRDFVDFDAPPMALAEPKGNEFSATLRKGARKPAKRRA